jgi:dihydropteroate synthase
MGIVNVTPDSFSDGDADLTPARALATCERLVGEGAHILDLGGESSRPGAEPVPLEVELARVLPVLRGAVALGVPVSIDSAKPEVMQAALDLGADIVNDIGALRVPGALEAVAAHPSCGVVLMHMRGVPRSMQAGEPAYGDVVSDVRDFLAERTRAPRRAASPRSGSLSTPASASARRPRTTWPCWRGSASSATACCRRCWRAGRGSRRSCSSPA